MVHLRMWQLTPSQIMPQPGGMTHVQYMCINSAVWNETAKAERQKGRTEIKSDFNNRKVWFQTFVWFIWWFLSQGSWQYERECTLLTHHWPPRWRWLWHCRQHSLHYTCTPHCYFSWQQESPRWRSRPVPDWGGWMGGAPRLSPTRSRAWDDPPRCTWGRSECLCQPWCGWPDLQWRRDELPEKSNYISQIKKVIYLMISITRFLTILKGMYITGNGW